MGKKKSKAWLDVYYSLSFYPLVLFIAPELFLKQLIFVYLSLGRPVLVVLLCSFVCVKPEVEYKICSSFWYPFLWLCSFPQHYFRIYWQSIRISHLITEYYLMICKPFLYEGKPCKSLSLPLPESQPLWQRMTYLDSYCIIPLLKFFSG